MEKKLQDIIDKKGENFSKEFLSHYLYASFGSMSKSEIEILIFHLLFSDSKELSNYEISNL